MLDGPERVEARLLADHRLLDHVLVGPVLAVGVPRARGTGISLKSANSMGPLPGGLAATAIHVEPGPP